MNIAIVPFYRNQYNNKFFEKGIESWPSLFKKKLEEKGHIVATVDLLPISVADQVIFFSFNLKYLLQLWFHRKNNQSVYFQFEPPVVTALHEAIYLQKIKKFIPFIFTWQDDLIDHINFFKFCYPYRSEIEKTEKINFSKKKLITLIVGNKHSNHPDELYTKRVDMINFFSNKCPIDFDFYGRGWEDLMLNCYQGAPQNKFTVINNYKFSICFENQQKINGYVTEKILDCINANSIPIYWGAENIESYIPKEVYIDYRDFGSNDALFEYLKKMYETEYEQYLAAADTFLKSTKYQNFLPEYFVAQIVCFLMNWPANKESSHYEKLSFIAWFGFKKFFWKFKDKTASLYKKYNR